MPKLSYGPEAKARTQHLLLALLDFANDELELADPQQERQLEALRSHLSLHWEGDRTLIIRTKLRHLETLSPLAPGNRPLTQGQIKEALSHLQNLVQWLEDNRTSRRGSEVWHFTIHWGAARRDRPGILQRFEEAWAANHPRQRPEQQDEQRQDKQPFVPTGGGIDWPQICRQALAQRRPGELTTNPLTGQDGLRFDWIDVYVPLEIIPPHKATEEEADGPAISPDLLLQQLQEGLPHPEVRIALVGEPGAGKTTLLQRLALGLLEQAGALPLWVSLADLEGRSLETYLLEDWLQGALRRRSLPPEIRDDFAQQIEQGRVWLLLDAVDEMGLALGIAPATALTKLAQQLNGWLGNAKVILTCRLNVWDSGKNVLTEFETYRLLGCRDRNQAQMLIQRWFQTQPERGHNLCVALERPELRRLRSALRNPLRLALLCRAWACGQGQLPQTKSLLYSQFVEAFYEWKQDIVPTPLAQRQQLNQALGTLALSAFRQSVPTFRLPLSLLEQALSSNLSVLDMLLQLGWLTPLGRSQQTGERLYGFYHATFQEYFAAQAIAQVQDFLCLSPADSQDKTQITPLFEPHWQEIILLWLGRADVAIASKEQLMHHLINHPDACGGYFQQRAYCLAAEALAEFPEFGPGETLIDQLIQWRFNLRGNVPAPLIQTAQRSLSRSDQTRVIAQLERYAQDPTLRPFDRWMVAYSLGKTYDFGNAVAIATLTELLQGASYSKNLQMDLARALGLVDPGNEWAIATLVESFTTTVHQPLQQKALLRLARIAPEHPLILPTLEAWLSGHPAPPTRPNAKVLVAALAAIAPDHPLVLQAQQAQISPPQRRKRQTKPKATPLALSQAAQLQRLLQRLEQGTDAPAQVRWAIKLGRLQPGHPEAIQTLVRHLYTDEGVPLLKQIGEGLEAIALPEQIPRLIGVARDLKQAEPSGQAERSTQGERRLLGDRLLWLWSERLGYDAFRLAFQEAWRGSDGMV